MEKSISKLHKEALRNGRQISFEDFKKEIDQQKSFSNASGDATATLVKQEEATEPGITDKVANSIYTLGGEIKTAAAAAVTDVKTTAKQPFISGCVPNCIFYGGIGLAIGVVAVLIYKRK